MLFNNEHGRALEKLAQFGYSPTDDAWIAYEYGRTYLGLHRYRDAVNAFEVQRQLKPDPLAFRKLAMAYLRAGSSDDVGRVIAAGRRRHPSDLRLKLSEAAHLIRISGEDEKARAEVLLRELHQQMPYNGGVLQQYCKLLCNEGRVAEAEDLVSEIWDQIYPDRFRLAIRVELLIGRRRWPDAIRELRTAGASDEHVLGLQKKVYLRWARSEPDHQDRVRVASEGLRVSVPDELRRNIPIMVTNAKLAALADYYDLWDSIVQEIFELNPSIGNALREQTDASYWEEEPFTD